MALRDLPRRLAARLDMDVAALRDALRIAVQTGAAALAMWFVLVALGRTSEAFVGVLSAVLILQPSIGGTLNSIRTRFAATFVGLAVGMPALILLPTGWSTGVALAGSLLILNGISKLRPDWAYGVICAVGLSLADNMNIWVSATDRLIAIALGAAIGIAASLLIWPDTAKDRFERHLASALRAFARALPEVVGKAKVEGAEEGVPERHRILGTLQDARDALGALEMADHASREARVDAVTEAWNALWLLDRATARTRDLTEAGLEGPLEDFRDAAGRVYEALGRGRRVPVREMERMREAAQALHDHLPRRAGDELLEHAAMVAFALGDVMRNTEALMEGAQRETWTDAPSWSERVSLRRAG
ncbi:FUSC family protein [Jannaschia sp. W003]|uniref:FUSC family protein n=1 Tax=Jannaschia sp. W003 TaxID=2867012 RepID=UPI0021A3A909|nr:FUSC family protein [Jannaschia sp. W003]UWQ20032.1 FUSC family protein [Jannaschia sp. W003]